MSLIASAFIEASMTEAPRQAVSAEERLAAFGDAFLQSIEGPPPMVQKPRRSPDAPSEAKLSLRGDDLATASVAGKRRKKKKSQKPSATKDDRVVRTSSLEASDKLSSDKPVQRLPPRMTAAEKRRFMSGNVADIRSKGGPKTTAKRHGDPEEDAEFRKTLRDVLEYVTPQLGKQERRQYEQAKIRALGGQIDERPKRPLNLLKQDAKIFERKRTAKLEEEKHLGVSMSASKHRGRYEVDKLLKEKKEMLKDKKRRREDGFLRLGLGAKENRGMAIISKGAIRKYAGRG